MSYYNYDQIDFTDSYIEFLKGELEKAGNKLRYQSMPFNGIPMYEEDRKLGEIVKEKQQEYEQAKKERRDFWEWEKSLGYSWEGKITTLDQFKAFQEKHFEEQKDKPAIIQALKWWSTRWLEAYNKEADCQLIVNEIRSQINEIRRPRI